MGKGSINAVHAPGGFAYLIRSVSENEITILNQRLHTVNTLVIAAIICFVFRACLSSAAYPKKQEAAGKPPLYQIK